MDTTTPIASASLQPPKKKSGVRRRYTTLRPPRRSISDNNKKEIIKEMETGDTAYSVLVDTVAGIFGGVAGKAVEYPAILSKSSYKHKQLQDNRTMAS